MAITYSSCCPPQAIQVGPQGPIGAVGPPGPTTASDVIAVGGVMGMTICGIPVTRSSVTGLLSWSPSGMGIGCSVSGVAVIIDPSTSIPASVSVNGLSIGPVDATGSGITNLCLAVGSCRAGGLTGAGASLTAGPGLVAVGTTLAIGDDNASPVPYSVTALGLQIGPVPSNQIVGLCAAVLSCITADQATYRNLLVTTAAVCAAGGITSVFDSTSVDLSVVGCQLTASVRLDPASPSPLSVTASGLSVGLPSAASLCTLGVISGVIQTATMTLTVDSNCHLSADVNMAALISGSGSNAITLGGDGRLIVTCSSVRPCFSALSPLAYNQTTGVFSVAPGVSGNVLTTVGSNVVWASLPTATTVLAGCGITVSGFPATTVAVNRTQLIGAGLIAGPGSCDIRLDTGSTTFTNGVCTYLTNLPSNGVASTLTELVGADCRTYTIPAAIAPDLISPSGTILVAGGGTFSLSVDVNWVDGDNIAAVEGIVCSHLASRAQNGFAVTGPGGTLLVGADCSLYRIPSTNITAGCGIAVSGGSTVSIDRTALVGLGLSTGSGACNIQLDTTSTHFRSGICTYFGTLSTGGAANAATLLVGADCRTYTLPPAAAETANTAGCGITASGVLNRTIAVDRSALFGTTASTSLEAGPGTCDLRVRIDGVTILRSGTGALFVDPCEVLQAGITSAGVPWQTGDRILVLDSSGSCAVRIPTLTLGCGLTGTGTAGSPLGINRTALIEVGGGLQVGAGTCDLAVDSAALVSATAGNALTTSGGKLYVATATTFVPLAGCGVTVSGVTPAGATFAINRTALIEAGGGLRAGAGTCDLAVDPPAIISATAGNALTISSGRLYVPTPATFVPTAGCGITLSGVTASGANFAINRSALIEANAGLRVGSGTCDLAVDIPSLVSPAGGNALGLSGGKLYVPAPTTFVPTAGCGITLSSVSAAGAIFGINRTALIEPGGGLRLGVGTCDLGIDFTSVLSTDASNQAILGTDGKIFVPPPSAFSGVVIGCGLSGLGTIGSPLATNRTALIEVGGGLKAGSGICDIAVDWCDAFRPGTVASGQILIKGTSGTCEIDTLNNPDCTAAYAIAGVGRISATAYGPVKFRERKTVRSVSVNTGLAPATDNIIAMDTAGGNLVLTLATPGACDATDFYIVKTSTFNTLTIVGGGSGNIAGLASVTLPAGAGAFGGTQGPSIHIAYTGAGWVIL